MATRGTRNMDAGEEKVEDKEMVGQLRVQARKIHRRALVTAMIVTLVALAFPSA